MTWVNLVNAIHRSTVACSCCCLMKHNKGKVNEHAKQSSYNRQTQPVSFVATFLSVASLRLFWLWCNTHLINREFVSLSSISKEISCFIPPFTVLSVAWSVPWSLNRNYLSQWSEHRLLLIRFNAKQLSLVTQHSVKSLAL